MILAQYNLFQVHILFFKELVYSIKQSKYIGIMYFLEKKHPKPEKNRPCERNIASSFSHTLQASILIQVEYEGYLIMLHNEKAINKH